MNKRAQGITEYALIFAAVVAALLTMQVYFKRGAQAVVKVSVDQLGGFGSELTSGLTPEKIQQMAIDQELDPKYGALKSYKVETTTNHSITSTTPVDGEGQKNITIDNWQDTTRDSYYVRGDKLLKGKVFYQELGN